MKGVNVYRCSKVHHPIVYPSCFYFLVFLYAISHHCRANNAASRPAFSPTALFVGGTSGIGEHLALKMANYTTNPHIIISGRNRNAAEAVIKELQQINSSPESKYEVV